MKTTCPQCRMGFRVADPVGQHTISRCPVCKRIQWEQYNKRPSRARNKYPVVVGVFPEDNGPSRAWVAT